MDHLEHEAATNDQHAREAMVTQAEELLQLASLPLAWSIRNDVLTNNTSNIDAYMTKLVQEKYVRRIVFADVRGVVVASTNVKLDGESATIALPGVDLVATRPRVDRAGSDLRLVVPVTAFERQIGTLVLDYSTGRSIDTKLGK